MKKIFGIMLILLVLGLFCGVSMAAEKGSLIGPAWVVAEMTGDTVIDVVLVALGTEHPASSVSGVAILKEDLQGFEKGIVPLTVIACAFCGKTFVSAQPSSAISYLPDISKGSSLENKGILA